MFTAYIITDEISVNRLGIMNAITTFGNPLDYIAMQLSLTPHILRSFSQKKKVLTQPDLDVKLMAH